MKGPIWHIGDIEVDGRTVLGPMSGYTTPAYRDYMKSFGAGVCVTEMVSDMGCIHGMRVTREFLEYPPNHPTGVQLFGSDPEKLSIAARYALEVNPDIDFFDVNMGCPVPKVNRTGAGSALMRDPQLCGRIVRALKKETGLPVTAKIRLGWTAGEINFRDVISELQAAEVDAISLHARTREERYAGAPHYDMVEGLQKEMSVPLIISGNIYLLADAIRAQEVTGAEAVMIARGGIGNPFLVTQVDRYFRTGETLPNPTVSQQIDWCIQLADELIRESGEEKAMLRMRSYGPRYIAGCFRCRAFRNMLATRTDSRESLIGMLEKIREKMGDEVVYTDGRPEDF